MFYLAESILWILAVPAAGSCFYLLTTTLLSAAPRPLPGSSRSMRFDLIIPAHNEEQVIAAAVKTALLVDYPADHFRVVVVADNCSDATARIAAEAGAHVLERSDTQRRGKGYALEFAFAESRDRHWADAVVVIDADAQVSRNLLEAFACRMERGEQAVQVHYGVSNTLVSWRTRLLGIAKAAFHIVRSRARERLKLSCGIRGNGWGVTHELLKRVPYNCFSLTEDLEFGIQLGLAGVRVAYADEAHSNAEMVSGEKDSRNQRRRWERGRMALMRSKTLPLLSAAFRRPSLVCFDLALDLLVLPLSYIVLNIMVMMGVAAAFGLLGFQAGTWLWLGVACFASLALHILRGWQLSGAGLQGLLDLGRAPFFLIWKLAVMLRSRDSKEWVRTKREGS